MDLSRQADDGEGTDVVEKEERGESLLQRVKDKAKEVQYERVLEEQKDKKVLGLVLRALQTTSMWQQKIQLMELGCDRATITLGIPPKITLKFEKVAPP